MTTARITGSAPDAWTFVTSHAQVLLYIATNVDARVRDIASELDLTERSVYRILGDLDDGGYITRRRSGNRVEFTVHKRKRLRAALVRDIEISQLLKLLAPGGG
jgi:DNA-binding MarR family transcriptional regulator